MQNNNNIKSFGEVFTSGREVDAMVDIVLHEVQRVDSKFLEPACGNGNFLIKIIENRLEILKKKYNGNQIEFERNAFLAISSLYGIEILKKNRIECVERLYLFFREIYINLFSNSFQEEYLESIKYVISKNIKHGDALSLKDSKNVSLIFSEWSLIKGNLVQRTDYAFDNLIAYKPFDEGTLFSDLGEAANIPPPTKVFNPINLLDLKNAK